ncbi:Protocadherin beta-11 [Nymphon striatum]|nr:Protocadherin beta-11 [Nymphon striatum]
MCPACTNVWVRDLGNYRYPVEKIRECPTQYGKKDPRYNRCYLTEGGSSESFTVNEKLNTGSVIGHLKIMGSVGDEGNISLYLSSEGIISIEDGTKNIVLMTKLDKEGLEGPSSATVVVYCNRTGTTDPPVPIPIRLIVTDYNDNAPQFVDAPYTVNISEVTVVDSVILDSLSATDLDQQGPSSTIAFSIDENQPYAHYLRVESSLQGKIVLNSSLDYETLTKFTVTIKAQDQGNPPRSAYTNLTVRVIDADDQNPLFYFDKYTAILPENPTPGTLLQVSPASVGAYDPDFGINASVSYSFTSEVSEYDYFDLDRRTGNIFLKQAVPEDFVTPVTLVIQATQDDNKDRYSLTTVTVMDDGGFNTNTLLFLQLQYDFMIPEGVTQVDHSIQTVQTNKPADKGVSFDIIEQQETFKIGEKGQIILEKPLDYETQKTYVFHILATYRGMNATTRVNVTVMDNNDHDPNFNQTQYTFYLNDADPIPGAFVGKVEVSDGDGDKVRLSLTGPHSKAFYMYDDGILRIKDVDAINSSETQLIVLATDTGIPPRQSSVAVTVMMPSKMALAKRASSTHSVILMIVFGSVLGILLLIIISLTLYIIKNKQYRNRLSAMMNSPGGTPKSKTGSSYSNGNAITRNMSNGTDNRESQNRSALGMENPIFNMADNNNTQPNHVDDTSRFPNRLKGKPIKVQPVQPPRVPISPNSISSINIPKRNATVSPMITSPNNISTPTPPPGTFFNENEFKPNNFTMNGNARNMDDWPNGSIPRRVKKLSWEDEQAKMTELDPEVSAAPLNRPQQNGSAKDPNRHSNDLTIYF